MAGFWCWLARQDTNILERNAAMVDPVIPLLTDPSEEHIVTMKPNAV
jgi:hypothetical protein